ncbi:MAG TPA: hypothetical protein DCL54_09355, partial [Alphaproteobacteria bacterium]|nr:hypothetical protein [Alphaproteobacteria bacterium]
FLANMSHELRTPLNAILGFSEIINSRMFGDTAVEKYAAYAGDINKSGTHLLALINDVLDLARIEAGRFDLNEEVFDLTGLCQEVVALMQAQGQDRQVSIQGPGESPLNVYAGKRALKQILLNLVSNAIKFTPPNGQISIELSESRSREVLLRVLDTGVGIAASDLERVLEQFGQGRHDIATARDKGVGLGLPIAKGLAEAHGGSLSLSSEQGRGTAVTVTLPASRLRQSTGAPVQTATAA